MIKGFRFGMILQLAIGPVFLLILNTSINTGILTALKAVILVAIVDSFYILLAIWGLGGLLEANKIIQKILKFSSSFLILLFGLSTLLSVFNISLIPVLSLKTTNSSHILIKVLLMTLSNPLTILFWTGVFSAKIQRDHLTKSQLYLFGCGAVLSTLVFLGITSILGEYITPLLNTFIYSSLNIFTGVFLIIYSLYILFKPLQHII